MAYIPGTKFSEIPDLDIEQPEICIWMFKWTILA